MADRSLKLSSVSKVQVERALTDRKWSIEDLAGEAGLARPTATNFRAGKAVDRKNFVKFCEVLGLNWESVSEQKIVPPETPIAPPSTPSQPDDALFQQVREHCCQKILNQHSRMRLLSGKEIGVDQLYVDVWLLNRPEYTYRNSPESLLNAFDIQKDRLALGKRIERKPGFEVANANAKLVILGKPGAGKTTFLKHLAADWCKDEDGFQPDLIAVLIELRQIRNQQWNLIEAIDQELGLENWSQFNALKQRIQTLKEQRIKSLEQQQEKRVEELQQLENQIEELQQQLEALLLSAILRHGRLLVLMDGLDEVPTNELRRDVQNQLRQIAKDYPKNRLILTCRTQIIESIPVGFTSVEVADFSEEQVARFVRNWFTASGQASAIAVQQWETFARTINHNPALKELTITPVLLSLMCLVLQDSGNIPLQRDWLYKEGIKLLLRQWNDTKKIDGWEVGSQTYRQLSVEQKEALLTEIAARKFENPDNFVLFQQEEIATQITQFLQLANSREGVAVLKAIEAQHGLLIERADELWSFSHLTFQEYFTVQWLTQLPAEQLAEKIASQQWQEAVKQIIRSQQPADRFLRLIKQAIDQFIAHEPKLQEFLTWVLQKSESIQVEHRLAAIRAFYSALALALDFARALDRTLALDLAFDRALDFDLARALDRALDFNLARALTLARDRALDLARGRVLDLDLALDLDHARALDRALDLDLDRALDLDLDLARTLDRTRALSLDFDRSLVRALSLDRALACNLDSELANKLAQFRLALLTASTENLQQWWQTHGSQWIEQLRQTMIEHRNIGHDWQFTETQTQQLKRYYDANKFLVNLMKIEGAVSNSVRVEIEDSLLLPWSELQRRQL